MRAGPAEGRRRGARNLRENLMGGGARGGGGTGKSRRPWGSRGRADITSRRYFMPAASSRLTSV